MSFFVSLSTLPSVSFVPACVLCVRLCPLCPPVQLCPLCPPVQLCPPCPPVQLCPLCPPVSSMSACAMIHSCLPAEKPCQLSVAVAQPWRRQVSRHGQQLDMVRTLQQPASDTESPTDSSSTWQFGSVHGSRSFQIQDEGFHDAPYLQQPAVCLDGAVQ